MKWNRDQTDPKKSGATPRDGSDLADLDEGALDCSMEELREFLEADLLDLPVDLEFKESLRRKLWDLVQVRNRMRGGDSEGH